MTISGNRITSQTTVANAAEDKRLEPIPSSPTGLALLPQYAVKWALAVGALAVAVGTVFAVFLPQPWAITGVAVSGAVVTICNLITGAGPGVRAAGTVVPASQQLPATAPRVGPPS
jgi:hypothetical protein